MSKLDDHYFRIFVVSVFVSLFVAFGIVPYNEARTYTRLTGKNVSWWDALWVELRVQEQPKSSVCAFCRQELDENRVSTAAEG